MQTSDFKDLVVWQKSMDMVTGLYGILNQFPSSERYGLCDQMRRCSVSVPSNIAEGHYRSKKERIHFLTIARGSLGELETQLIICQRLNYISNDVVEEYLYQIKGIGVMLNSLIRSISKNS